ncbi:MtrB/PioB family decaheme-associated outer membrane protein [uncultured Ferrimonas sp.]|uniref:MtrB/PioB family decaheme-associated outer membrane protein n=1 Tax=uncultured Ferrimonas sp. TaxID=432640 RepID=UPI00261CF54C|nr:MtrB/PioB family decaheme-associated outer membrane protein [uncultured Ferrimonas sp.]
MKMKLSLVALALVNVGAVQAASFNLHEANTATVNKAKWACKRCQTEADNGQVGLSLLSVSSDDAKAANRFGQDDGEALALQANLSFNDADHGRLLVQAHNLGAETGHGELRYGADGIGLYAGYQSQLRVHSDNAQSQYLIRDGVIELDNQVSDRSLQLKRESYLLGGEFKGDAWRGFVDYRYQSKTGQQANYSQFISLPDANTSGAPVHYVAPVDQVTHTVSAGGELSGERWLAGLKYQNSQFNNDVIGLNAMAGGSINAAAPDNELQQLIGFGQYRFDRHSLSARVVQSWHYQDQQFVTTEGVAAGIHSADAEVETLAINARWLHRASAALRIKAQFDYRDRDNQTPIRAFESIDFDNDNGRAVENVALDRQKQSWQLSADYRLAKGIKISGGVQQIDKELTDTVTEKTDEQRLFAGLNLKQWQHWKVALDAEFSRRDGSQYQADAATSDESNVLLRKYYLADRDRQQLQLALSHTPLPALVMDAKLRFANDDYRSTEIGLTEAQDSGYDLSLSYQWSPQLSTQLFAGQQWIESKQTDLNASGRYQADIDDRFSHIGVGGRYRGLLQDKLELGMDYRFSESESKTELSSDVNYGDYLAWFHDASIYAQYQLSAKAQVKADYRYQRFYDSNYASVNHSSYTTLGDLDSNDVAHMVMLTFSYAL